MWDVLGVLTKDTVPGAQMSAPIGGRDPPLQQRLEMGRYFVKIFRNELGLRKLGLDDSVPTQLWPRVPHTLESGDSGAGSFFLKIPGHSRETRSHSWQEVLTENGYC